MPKEVELKRHRESRGYSGLIVVVVVILHLMIELAQSLFLFVESDFFGEDVMEIVVKVLAPIALLVLELGQGNCSFEVREDTSSTTFCFHTKNAFFVSL